jgi:hypothetical protein
MYTQEEKGSWRPDAGGNAVGLAAPGGEEAMYYDEIEPTGWEPDEEQMSREELLQRFKAMESFKPWATDELILKVINTVTLRMTEWLSQLERLSDRSAPVPIRADEATRA